jgi:hypothetical protein
MKLDLSLTLALLLFQTPTPPLSSQQTKASIEGTVTNSSSGEPLERAQITLIRIVPPPPPPAPGQAPAPVTPPVQIAPVLTQGDGKFEFEVDGQSGNRHQSDCRTIHEGCCPEDEPGTIANCCPVIKRNPGRFARKVPKKQSS